MAATNRSGNHAKQREVHLRCLDNSCVVHYEISSNFAIFSNTKSSTCRRRMRISFVLVNKLLLRSSLTRSILIIILLFDNDNAVL